MGYTRRDEAGCQIEGRLQSIDGLTEIDDPLCESCHGPEGKGDGPTGLTALPMPRDFRVGEFKFDADSDGRTGSDEDLFLVIRDGAMAAGGSPLMAPWGQLGAKSIRELVV